MDLPSFDEFRNSISDERFKELCGRIEDTEVIRIVDGFTPENINAFCDRLISFTLKGAFNLQMAFLEEYHEWLRSNL